MSMKTIGTILIVAGVLAILVFGLADVIGLGQNPDLFGPRQIIGTAAGGIALIAGVVLALRRPQA